MNDARAIRMAKMIASRMARGGYANGGYADGGDPTSDATDDGADYDAAVAAGQNADVSGARPLTIYRNKPDTSKATVEGPDTPPPSNGGQGIDYNPLSPESLINAPVSQPTSWLDDVIRKAREYTMPRAEDYRRGAEGPSSLVRQGIENMRSGEPWRMLAGAGQDVLGTVSEPFAPVAGAFEAAKGSAERTFGPAAGHAVDVASNLNPDFLPTALAKAAHYSPELAMAGMGMKAANPTVDLAKDVITSPRVTNDVGLYSHGAEAAANLPQMKGTPQQFRAMLEKQGVKPAEFENSGYDQAFAGKNIVTKDDVAQHFQNAMPQVEETVLGKTPDAIDAGRALAESHGNNWDELSLADQNRYIRKASGRNITEYADDPKFEQYTLPGGENYREVLLKLPSDARVPTFEEWFNKTHISPLENYADNPRVMEILRNKYNAEANNMPKEVSFQSSHWDDPNVLAHLRMSDRTAPMQGFAVVNKRSGFAGPVFKTQAEAEADMTRYPQSIKSQLSVVPKQGPDQKILHIEEFQSDWGQKGKKEGFVTKYKPEDIKEIDPANITSERSRNEFWNFKTPTGSISVPRNSRWPTMEAARQYILDNMKSPGTPTAPYVTNTQAWTDLALKRALKEAAEGGYDKLVWTPGAEQAKRYDLSKHIDRMELTDNSSGGVGRPSMEGPFKGGLLNAYDKNGQRVISQYINDEDHLSNMIGKEASKKLLSESPKEVSYSGIGSRSRSLEGADLSVGGEGMKGYYDKILPGRLKELTKKLDPDAKIELNSHQLPTGEKLHSLEITPLMRERIKKGLPAFKSGGAVAQTPNIDKALALTRFSPSPYGAVQFIQGSRDAGFRSDSQ